MSSAVNNSQTSKRKELSFTFEPYFEETFKKERVLGRGGFGRVWQVLSNGKQFAVKRVRIQGSLSDNLIRSQNFSLREALIPSSLSHANIIFYIDCWIEHEKPLGDATSAESFAELSNNCLAIAEKSYQDVGTQTSYRKFSETSTPGLSSIGRDSGVSSTRLMSRLESVARNSSTDFRRLNSLLEAVPDESSSSRVFETSRFHHSWEPSPGSSVTSEIDVIEDYFSETEIQQYASWITGEASDERNGFVEAESLDNHSSNTDEMLEFPLDISEIEESGNDAQLVPASSQLEMTSGISDALNQNRVLASNACTHVRQSCEAIEPSCFVLYIQMPLYETDLKQYIESRDEISTERNLNFFCQIIQGLVHIHENDVIHRDIKPANIFLNLETLGLCIGDFGRAVKKSDSYKTDEGLKMTSNAGTTLYMAPEVQGSSYNEKCDLYSAGIVLFELFTVTAIVDENIRLSDINFLKESRFIAPDFRDQFPQIANLILCLTATNPDTRPSAAKTLGKRTLFSFQSKCFA